MCLRLATSPMLFVVCVYWCPSDPVDQQLDSLRGAIACCKDGLLIIAGDFNCRLGCDADDLSDLLPAHCRLAPRRSSRDQFTNSRGSALRSVIAEEGLFVVNGRTISDPSGDFTFVAPTGRSLIDLVLCPIQAAAVVQDAGILPLATHSDHFPIFVSLSLPSGVSSPLPAPSDAALSLRWNDSLKSHFNHILRSSLVTIPSPSAAEFVSLLRDTGSELGMLRHAHPPPSTFNQPWFNRTCAFFKKCHLSALRSMRASGFSEDETKNFLFLKKNYSLVLTHTRLAYLKDLTDSVLSARNSSSFWCAIRKLSPSRASSDPELDVAEVSEHFRALFNSHARLVIDEVLLNNLSVPELDKEISLGELDLVLKSCKSGKTPGPDGIPY